MNATHPIFPSFNPKIRKNRSHPTSKSRTRWAEEDVGPPIYPSRCSSLKRSRPARQSQSVNWRKVRVFSDATLNHGRRQHRNLKPSCYATRLCCRGQDYFGESDAGRQPDLNRNGGKSLAVVCSNFKQKIMITIRAQSVHPAQLSP